MRWGCIYNWTLHPPEMWVSYTTPLARIYYDVRRVQSPHPRQIAATDFSPELTTLLSTLPRNGECFARSGGSLSAVSRSPLESIHVLTLLALWISSGVMMQGFDIVAGSQLVSLPAFRKQFGILQPSGNYLIPAYYISAWSSIAPACEIVATFIVVPSLEKFGRKPGILVATVISVAGVLLQQLATDWRTHLAGRGVNGERSSSRIFRSLTLP